MFSKAYSAHHNNTLCNIFYLLLGFSVYTTLHLIYVSKIKPHLCIYNLAGRKRLVSHKYNKHSRGNKYVIWVLLPSSAYYCET